MPLSFRANAPVEGTASRRRRRKMQWRARVSEPTPRLRGLQGCFYGWISSKPCSVSEPTPRLRGLQEALFIHSTSSHFGFRANAPVEGTARIYADEHGERRVGF